MNKYVSAILVGSLVLPGFALAENEQVTQGYTHHHEKGCQHERGMRDGSERLQRMQEHLGLNEQQVKQIGDIIATSKSERQALRKASKDVRQKLQAVLQSEQPDQAQIRKLADEQGRIKADMIVLHSKQRTAINQVLTPEQRQKMQSHFKQRGNHGDDAASAS